jgi:serine/threonine-protein kinase HipA
MKRCLHCYLELKTEEDFHPHCSKKIFGTTIPPILPYSENDISELALSVVQRSVTITGVQPKLSMNISTIQGSKKLTIVGLWGDYILKPPSEIYPELPENEDLTMHLAHLCKIKTVPHSLIRMKSGKLAYITKRIDRVKKNKIHMEDMCQLTERLTEHKYNGSHEQIAKAILKYSVNPVLDVTEFYEQVIFSFIVGNADMHLKNFSLINAPGIGYHLAPAYDLLCTTIVTKDDQEELALNLGGKKRRIDRADFIGALAQAHVSDKVIRNIFLKYEKLIPQMINFIEISFLSSKLKTSYIDIIKNRSVKLNIKI